MAKKVKKSQPVSMKKNDGDVIHIKLGLPKFRVPKMSGGGRHHTREDDVRKGRSRKPKHKGRTEEQIFKPRRKLQRRTR